MKVGLIVAGQYLHDAPAEVRGREMVEQVRLARDLGFDSVWVTHHYLIEFQTFQPIPLLARFAAEAGDMELGTAIYVLPLQHPVEVAENFATLDALTGGRLIFGVAQGYRDVEFQSLGVPRKERAPRFEEGLELITRLWTGDEVTFAGQFYQVDRVRISMPPVRKPRPPIWIGATEDAAIVRAARLGDAWMVGPRVTLPALRKQLGVYREALRREGRSVEREYPMFREVVLAPTTAEAQAAATRNLRTKYEAYARWRYSDLTFDDLVRDAFIVGDAETCVRTLTRYRDDAGMTHLLARVQTPGVSQADALRGIRALGERGIPALRR
ncbi:MAG: LLM class flavin-dependent oxidoreductase [Candidatus Rokubacteria bacterium]|nr:LLM class flavin-dependent oxidoreductase [Candidatus Rokubacteria bacterium]